MSEHAEARGLNVEAVLRLHNLTTDIAGSCERQLRKYLDALAPLFRPRRILGDYIEGSGREGVAGAESNLAELQQIFQGAVGRPIDLHWKLTTPIESISTQLQIYPWEYLHEVPSGKDQKRITIRSPLTWVLSYPSTYSLSMFRQVIAGGHQRDQSHIAEFVLRACVMTLMFEKLSGLASVFEGVRYHVEVRKSPELGELPLVTISAPFSSMRPSDQIVVLASGVSGRNAFEEIIDLDAVRQISDPVREQIRQLLETHGETL